MSGMHCMGMSSLLHYRSPYKVGCCFQFARLGFNIGNMKLSLHSALANRQAKKEVPGIHISKANVGSCTAIHAWHGVTVASYVTNHC